MRYIAWILGPLMIVCPTAFAQFDPTPQNACVPPGCGMDVEQSFHEGGDVTVYACPDGTPAADCQPVAKALAGEASTLTTDGTARLVVYAAGTDCSNCSNGEFQEHVYGIRIEWHPQVTVKLRSDDADCAPVRAIGGTPDGNFRGEHASGASDVVDFSLFGRRCFAGAVCDPEVSDDAQVAWTVVNTHQQQQSP